MKLKSQITLLISAILVLSLLSISALSIYKLKAKQEEEIKEYKEEESKKLRIYLKHIVDVAFESLEAENRSLQSSEFLSEYERYFIATDSMGLSLEDYKREKLEMFVTKLSEVKFDRNEGYFWITNNTLPFPTMIMHAANPSLKGVTLNDPKFNVTTGTNKNIYQERAEQCNQFGEAFIDYYMKKPGTDEVINKVSYSRLNPSLKWIVSSGFYTDQIDAAVKAKEESLSQDISNIIMILIGFSLLVLIIGLAIAFYFSTRLTNAILEIKGHLQQLSKGKIVEVLVRKRKDEVGDMTISLNAVVHGLETYTGFAKEIGKGNLDQDFQPLSQEDILGNELINMRDNLKKAEEEKRIRDWSNEGFAVFGELLRKHNSETTLLLTEVMKKLISYLKMNQGAAFLMDEDRKQLHQVVTFAYSRQKFVTTKLALGEGLIGQCALEMESIYMTDIPTDYIKLTSGLGESSPQNLFLVPLVHNGDVYGVLELAGFNKLTSNEIAFIEKIAESIASSVSSVQVNEKTKKLLEQSQQMAEEMRAQEEELRQNQEELEATQEEMRRTHDALVKENELLKKNTPILTQL